MSKGKIEKIHLYALIKPYDINLALTFYPFETIGLVQLFVEDTIRKLKSTPYKIGRIEKNQIMLFYFRNIKLMNFYVKMKKL